MTLPASGPLSLNDIQGEFGGSNPIGLNEYYAGGGLVPSGTTGTYGAVPSSGTLSVQNFYGTSNYIPVYVEDLFSTYLYTGTGATQIIPNGIALGTGGSGTGGSGYWTSTSYLTAPSSSAFTFGTGDFTIEAWIFPASSDQTSTIFSAKGTDYYTDRPILYQVRQRVRLFWYSSGNVVTTDYVITAGQWQHIAVTRSGSDVRIFYNGVLQQTATNTTSLDSSTPTIGQSIDGNDWPYAGYISNLRVVKGTAVYTSNFTPSTTPLTAISGTSLLTLQSPSPFVDNSSNNFALTMTGTIGASAAGPFLGTVTGYGGLTWIKQRSAAADNQLVDTVRGATYKLVSNTTGAQGQYTTGLTSFNTNGFSIDTNTQYNNPSQTYVSWTFRKQPKFFDVVTYTGNGTNPRNISHNLGSVPGCVIVKATSTTGNWSVYHRGVTPINNNTLSLQSTAAASDGGQDLWGNGATVVVPTSAVFTVSNSLNTNGTTYVAYLFAHNAGGFGLTGTDNVISCGSYTGTGANGNNITLGYEPQWLLIKRTSGADPWLLFDTMRGMSNTGDKVLYPNYSDPEDNVSTGWVVPTATGFVLNNTQSSLNGSGQSYIYIAIRRGPMKVPTDATTVFNTVLQTPSSYSTKINEGFPVDLLISGMINGNGNPQYVESRLQGVNTTRDDSGDYPYLSTSTLSEETPQTWGLTQGWDNTGFYQRALLGINIASWGFGRAPKFFDEVCPIGFVNGTLINHNLGVTPELIIVKTRNTPASWMGAVNDSGNIRNLSINSASGGYLPGLSYSSYFNSTTINPTGILNSAGGASKGSGVNVAIYLFATCPGVSKVGSYTGTGSTQTINCGFTGGARWVMIKRTDSSGEWYVWDTARGMVSGTDPALSMNTGASQYNANSVYTATTGFQLLASPYADVNTNGGTYIYLAIA